MRLLVQAILSVSGESKKPDLEDCIALQRESLQSAGNSCLESDSRYMAEFSQRYQTDETYSQAIPDTKQSKCCPG